MSVSQCLEVAYVNQLSMDVLLRYILSADCCGINSKVVICFSLPRKWCAFNALKEFIITRASDLKIKLGHVGRVGRVGSFSCRSCFDLF